jgi:hypothetical protein
LTNSGPRHASAAAAPAGELEASPPPLAPNTGAAPPQIPSLRPPPPKAVSECSSQAPITPADKIRSNPSAESISSEATPASAHLGGAAKNLLPGCDSQDAQPPFHEMLTIPGSPVVAPTPASRQDSTLGAASSFQDFSTVETVCKAGHTHMQKARACAPVSG